MNVPPSSSEMVLVLHSEKFNLLKPLYIQHKYGENQLYAHFGQRYFSTPDENFHLSLVKRQFQISLSPSGWRLASAGYQCLASDGALFSVIGVLFIRSGTADGEAIGDNLRSSVRGSHGRVKARPGVSVSQGLLHPGSLLRLTDLTSFAAAQTPVHAPDERLS